MSARGGKKKATKLSRSSRAGVIFPVGRMMRYLRTGTHKYRIGMGAPVYMAAVIEYLAGRLVSASLSIALFCTINILVCNKMCKTVSKRAQTYCQVKLPKKVTAVNAKARILAQGQISLKF